MKANLLVLSLFFTLFIGYGQNGKGSSLDGLPQEKVFLHFNAKTLFAGERLYYKMYCLDNSTKQATDLSQIGYVELVDEKGFSIFKHKLRLKDGNGVGDFFMPADIPTGTYNLYGYTQLMINFGTDTFFKQPIFVVNPYQNLEERFLEEELDSVSVAGITIDADIDARIAKRNAKGLADQIEFNQEKIGKRQLVSIKLANWENTIPSGSYSLSISKLDELTFHLPITSESFHVELGQLPSKKGNNKITYLPEFRGEILKGKVLQKANKLPAKKESISLSMPGLNHVFKIALTDNNGDFYFNLNQEYDNTTAVIQHLSEDWENYEIIFDSTKIDFGKQKFESLRLNQSMQQKILERSIKNQIENAYYGLKPDSISPSNRPIPFYQNMEKVYFLDDYTRFNTVKETIVEVVENVSIRQMPNGDQSFLIKGKDGLVNSVLLPMVFVDGLYLKKHQDFMDYNSRKIASIGYTRDRFFIGSQIYHGALDIRTIEGLFYENFSKDYTKVIDLQGPLSNKAYYSPTYGNGEDKGLERIPDFRRQLLWLPNITPEKEIKFYTSDFSGDYLISIEGFSDDGNPISISKKLTVN